VPSHRCVTSVGSATKGQEFSTSSMCCRDK
jgi:hypothetical protein